MQYSLIVFPAGADLTKKQGEYLIGLINFLAVVNAAEVPLLHLAVNVQQYLTNVQAEAVFHFIFRRETIEFWAKADALNAAEGLNPLFSIVENDLF